MHASDIKLEVGSRYKITGYRQTVVSRMLIEVLGSILVSPDLMLLAVARG